MAATYDIVVDGDGSVGCFAAATAAVEGGAVSLRERTPGEAGQIACGDAIEGKRTFPGAVDRKRRGEEPATALPARRFADSATGRAGGSTRRTRRPSVRATPAARTPQLNSLRHV